MTKTIESYTGRTVEQAGRSVEDAISYGFLIHGGNFESSHFSVLMEYGILPIAELAKIGIEKYSAYNDPRDICATMLPDQPTAFYRLGASGNAEVYAIGERSLSGLQMAIVIDPETLPTEYTITPVGEFPAKDYPQDTVGRITIDSRLRKPNDFWWYAESHIHIPNTQPDAKGIPPTSWTGVLVGEDEFKSKLSVWLNNLPTHLRKLDIDHAVKLIGKSVLFKPLIFVPTRQAQNIEV